MERLNDSENGCLSEREVCAFALGELDAERQSRAEAHLAGCPACRQKLALFTRMLSDDPDLARESAALDRATRPAVLELIRERLSHARDAARPAATHPAARRAWGGMPAWALAAAAAVLLAAGVVLFWPRESHLERGMESFRAAVSDERPVEMRLSDQDYAPFSKARGGGERDLEAARAMLEVAVEEDPSAEALHAYGRVLLAEGRAADAAARLSRARELAPADPDVAVDLAAAEAERGDAAGALRLLDEVLAREPGRRDALFNRALALRQAWRADEARAAWRRYLEVDPSSPWAGEARSHLADLGER